MTQLEEMISIETPTFILIHKKINISSMPFVMFIENNSFQLPGFVNLTNNENQINQTKQIILKVNILFKYLIKTIYFIIPNSTKNFKR